MASLLPRTVTAARSADADDAELPVVIDPACQEAIRLSAVADRFGNLVRLVGQEIQESAADLAALNLRSGAHDVEYEIQVGDSLLDNQLTQYLGAAAAVVCDPPSDQSQWPSIELTTDPRWEFGTPAPRDGELAWVQHCYAHLRPGGVAIITVSPRTCFQTSSQHIRTELVRSGVLRDVIALPTGLSMLPDAETHLWVLQRPVTRPENLPVRIVELSGLADAADVPYEYAAWQRLFHDADPTVVRAVPRVELLDGEVNLLPSRHVAASVHITADALTQVTDRLRIVYAHAAQVLPTLGAPGTSPHFSYVTLGELERAGALTIRSRDSTPLRGDVILRRLGREPVVATGTADDDLGVAQVVEIDESRLDAHFVATFLRANANALPVTNTHNAVSRDDLRRCRVPRLRLAEQRQYGDAFRRLLELEEFLTTLAGVSAKVIEQNIHGLVSGALTPEYLLNKHTGANHPTEYEANES